MSRGFILIKEDNSIIQSTHCYSENKKDKFIEEGWVLLYVVDGFNMSFMKQ